MAVPHGHILDLGRRLVSLPPDGGLQAVQVCPVAARVLHGGGGGLLGAGNLGGGRGRLGGALHRGHGVARGEGHALADAPGEVGVGAAGRAGAERSRRERCLRMQGDGEAQKHKVAKTPRCAPAPGSRAQAGVEHVDVHTSTIELAGGVGAVEGQGTLVDPIKAPGDGGVDGGKALGQLDGLALRQQGDLSIATILTRMHGPRLRAQATLVQRRPLPPVPPPQRPPAGSPPPRCGRAQSTAPGRPGSGAWPAGRPGQGQGQRGGAALGVGGLPPAFGASSPPFHLAFPPAPFLPSLPQLHISDASSRPTRRRSSGTASPRARRRRPPTARAQRSRR